MVCLKSRLCHHQKHITLKRLTSPCLFRTYPGCQRLFMRGFWFWSSLISDPREKPLDQSAIPLIAPSQLQPRLYQNMQNLDVLLIASLEMSTPRSINHKPTQVQKPRKAHSKCNIPRSINHKPHKRKSQERRTPTVTFLVLKTINQHKRKTQERRTPNVIFLVL